MISSACGGSGYSMSSNNGLSRFLTLASKLYAAQLIKPFLRYLSAAGPCGRLALVIAPSQKPETPNSVA